MKSLQETFAPNSICYGCGPSNPEGLRIRSFAQGDEAICDWKAKPFHEAFPGVLNGGTLGTLLDCHSNWTAAWFIMKSHGLEQPLCTVTAEYAVKLMRPTPSKETYHVVAKVAELKGDRAIIEATLTVDDKVCATCRGTFVAVKPGHPAYHRWY